MKTPDRCRSGTPPSAENGLRGLYFGVWCYRRPTIGASPATFHTVSEVEFSEVRRSRLPIMHSLKLSTTAWRYLFGVETRRLRSIRCTIVYQEVTTRNRATTREF